MNRGSLGKCVLGKSFSFHQSSYIFLSPFLLAMTLHLLWACVAPSVTSDGQVWFWTLVWTWTSQNRTWSSVQGSRKWPNRTSGPVQGSTTGATVRTRSNHRCLEDKNWLEDQQNLDFWTFGDDWLKGVVLLFKEGDLAMFEFEVTQKWCAGRGCIPSPNFTWQLT